ncbi:MAG: S8 family serine peptidase [Pseudonocardiaceae bacterium]|nr:S8 family serine peptidase [Pseudonocardiaceae bacterium]
MGPGHPGNDDEADFPAEFRLGEGRDEIPEPAADLNRGDLTPVPPSPQLVADSVLSRPLQEQMTRVADRPIGVVIELRHLTTGGLDAAERRVRELIGPTAPVQVNGPYLTTALWADEITQIVAVDGARDQADTTTTTNPAPRGAIHRIWPNFEIRGLIVRTVITTKCMAAHRAFDATGQGIVWAVLDSGIDRHHGHFRRHSNLDGLQHQSFLAGKDKDPLVDDAGHGTHVAGILAGEQRHAETRPPLVAASWYHDDAGATRVGTLELPSVSGMAPRCRLLSCKVLRGDGSGDITALLAALRYIQQLNDNGRDLRVHGVNISVGHPWDPSWFAAGRTPVCREVDRLVQSGVVVVVAAGNTGYGYARGPSGRAMRLGFDMTINDPGNAQLGITVGSTSSSPHSSGVSYFSSKGPTGDGRMKPDLVAPGERVISAAAGELLEEARREVDGATYVENSGTSMSAPHVSGAAAALLSVHREFVGRPDEVKRILLSSATDLGRSSHFQGAGLVDAMRAIQSI